MLDQKIRGLWDRAMRPVGRTLGRSWLSANAITTVGLLVQGASAGLILQGRLLAAGLVAMAAALADGLDGAVAKAKGTSSKFGAFYDSTSDRIADALYFVPIAWLYGVHPTGAEERSELIAALALVTLVAGFLVSYARARAEGLGLDAKVGIAERAERMGLVILGLLFDQLLVALAILSVLSVITFFQRVFHVRAQARG